VGLSLASRITNAFTQILAFRDTNIETVGHPDNAYNTRAPRLFAFHCEAENKSSILFKYLQGFKDLVIFK
jgi:hypothetical protein